MSCCEDQVNIGIGDKRDIQEWMTGITYQEREEVDHANSIYICLVCHVSTDFATDLGAGYWLLIGGAAMPPASNIYTNSGTITDGAARTVTLGAGAATTLSFVGNTGTVLFLHSDGRFSIGEGATTFDDTTVVIGKNAVGGSSNVTVIGHKASSSGGADNIVIGVGGGAAVTATTSAQSIAIGSYGTNTNNRTNAIAIGTTSVINGDSGIAIGNDTTSGFRSTVVGGFATANVTRGVAFGELAAVAGTGGVALGSQTDAGGEAIAVGYIAQATFDYSIAIGSGANGGGVYSTAMGYTASAGAFGTVYGAFAATVANGTAIGRNANAADGVALGWYANSQSGAGIAIGEQSATEAARFYNINIHAGAGGNDKSILHLYNLVGGAGYVDATYPGVSLTGGSGAGAVATIVVSGGAVTSVTLTARGANYLPADVLSANAADLGGAGAGFSITVMLSAGVFGGNTSVGIGSGQTTAYGFAAVALGHGAGAAGNGTAVGVSAIANSYASAFGNETQAEGAGSTAIGVSYVRAKATNSIAMGQGFFSGSPFYMENNVANSFGVGFAKSSPQILLAPAAQSYINTSSEVWIGDGSAAANAGVPNNIPGTISKFTVKGNVEVVGNGTGNVGFVWEADDGERVLIKLVNVSPGVYQLDTGTVL